MSLYSFVNKWIIPRKAHQCCWCAEQIEKGERCYYSRYVNEDGFYRQYMHAECQEALDNDIENQEFYQEGWNPGDFKRGSTEEA